MLWTQINKSNRLLLFAVQKVRLRNPRRSRLWAEQTASRSQRNMHEQESSRHSNLGHSYDFVFCGAGASASLLLLQLHRRGLLKEASVLIVDREAKNKNDKTFCFWTKADDSIAHELSALISHTWERVKLTHSNVFALSPLRYNHISSIDLYEAVQLLAAAHGWHNHTGRVEAISHHEKTTLITVDGKQVRAKYIFDSRPPERLPLAKGEVHIAQSFFGWVIQTESEIPESDAFRFMDFNIRQNGHTQFLYVLPFSPHRALVEVTRFGSQNIDQLEAEEILSEYIANHYGKFEVLEIEQGCIPMSNGRISNESIRGVAQLGARNYSIKPSTGYAFKNMYEHSQRLSDAIEQGKEVSSLDRKHSAVFSTRFAFYDALLLHILAKHPHHGKPIFERLFKGVEITTILKFLDEKTSLREDISIFSRLPFAPFVRALLQRIVHYPWFRPVVLTLLTLLLFLLGHQSPAQFYIGYGLLLLGFVAVGIPHGAVDHLLEIGNWNLRSAPMFIVKYLAQAAAMAVLWYLSPLLALFIFLGYSSWHFGQTDGKQFGMSPVLSVLWGASVLLFVLSTHQSETTDILLAMGARAMPIESSGWALAPWFIYALFRKHFSFALTVCWLMLSSQLPLLLAFGLYFLGQHSLSSWQHLKQHLQLSHTRIWLHSLPFHAGAWLMLAGFYLALQASVFENEAWGWGLFFIFISCISLPHALSMRVVYRTNAK